MKIFYVGKKTMGFKERLKELRKQRELSQQNIADMLDVTKQTISQYERGVREPDYDNLLALCDIFNVSTDYILGKDDRTPRYLTSDQIRLLDSKHSLLSDEHHLLTSYRKLNDFGKKKAREDVEDLTYVPRYVKDSDSTLLQAAHERTDIEIPEGIDTSDDKYFD